MKAAQPKKHESHTALGIQVTSHTGMSFLEAVKTSASLPQNLLPWLWEGDPLTNYGCGFADKLQCVFYPISRIGPLTVIEASKKIKHSKLHLLQMDQIIMQYM